MEPSPAHPWRRQRHDDWLTVSVWTATAISRTLAVYCIAQGAFVIGYGDDRWTGSPALTAALQLPGGTLTWGMFILTAGLLALIGSSTRRMSLTRAGHALAGLWSMFFATAQAVTVLPSGAQGPSTGVLVYGAEAVVFFILAYGAGKLR